MGLTKARLLKHHFPFKGTQSIFFSRKCPTECFLSALGHQARSAFLGAFLALLGLKRTVIKKT